MIIINNNNTTHLKSLVSPVGVVPPGLLLSGWGPGPGPDLGGGRVGGLGWWLEAQVWGLRGLWGLCWHREDSPVGGEERHLVPWGTVMQRGLQGSFSRERTSGPRHGFTLAPRVVGLGRLMLASGAAGCVQAGPGSGVVCSGCWRVPGVERPSTAPEGSGPRVGSWDKAL